MTTQGTNQQIPPMLMVVFLLDQSWRVVPTSLAPSLASAMAPSSISITMEFKVIRRRMVIRAVILIGPMLSVKKILTTGFAYSSSIVVCNSSRLDTNRNFTLYMLFLTEEPAYFAGQNARYNFYRRKVYFIIPHQGVLDLQLSHKLTYSQHRAGPTQSPGFHASRYHLPHG
jgi:hypothetical protein